MELNTFFHYSATSIFKSSKGAVKKKSLGIAALNKKKEKRFLLRINLVFRYFSSKIIVISKNLKFKILRPPLNHFATHQGVATPSLKSPGIGHAIRTWSAVCSVAPHLQYGERAKPICV